VYKGQDMETDIETKRTEVQMQMGKTAAHLHLLWAGNVLGF